jgi:tRNA A-37 threonylcarbamoyl transferase component Bud32
MSLDSFKDQFEAIMEGYRAQAPAKQSKAVISKLDEVRLRGRKKLAFG